jgi:hypothetical protein
MVYISSMPDMYAIVRQLTGLVLLLASVVVLAQTVERLESIPEYSDRVTDEIYDNAGAWRLPPVTENEWRPQPEENKSQSRFTFGYDSAYEEMQNRNDDQYRTDPMEFGGERPGSIFRFNF